MRRIFIGSIVLALLSASMQAGFFSAPTSTAVAVNVDVTPDGKKLSPPTVAKPAYYFPVMGGFREMGGKVAGEKSPPAATVAHLVAKTLAAQGYLVMNQQHTHPTLLLVFNWGYLNPQTDDLGAPDDPQKISFNEPQMIGLVGGSKFDYYAFDIGREDVIQAAHENRYFIIVSAFDFDSAVLRKKKLLWKARMSVPSSGVEFADVLPAMLAVGGPRFGRETARPEFITAPIVPNGKVEVGTPQVVPGASASVAPGPTPTPPPPTQGK